MAEEPAHIDHAAWIEARPKPTRVGIARALAVLDRPTGNAADACDELPENYEIIRSTRAYQRAAGGK
jgi:hypothetical protein